MPSSKNQTLIFFSFVFCLDFCATVRTSKSMPNIFSRKSCPKICLENHVCCLENCTIQIVWTRNKCCCLLLDFHALFVAVLSLDLRAAKFFLLLRKNGNFLSSLSRLSLLSSIYKSEAKCLSHAFLRKP